MMWTLVILMAAPRLFQPFSGQSEENIVTLAFSPTYLCLSLSTQDSDFTQILLIWSPHHRNHSSFSLGLSSSVRRGVASIILDIFYFWTSPSCMEPTPSHPCNGSESGGLLTSHGLQHLVAAATSWLPSAVLSACHHCPTGWAPSPSHVGSWPLRCTVPSRTGKSPPVLICPTNFLNELFRQEEMKSGGKEERQPAGSVSEGGSKSKHLGNQGVVLLWLFCGTFWRQGALNGCCSS